MFSTAFPWGFKAFFGLVYSFVFMIMSFIATPLTDFTEEMPVVPEDFEPAVRFVVCTDSHNNNQNIADMVSTCFEIYGDDGIDLFVHTGDFTEIGTDGEMQRFHDTITAAVGDKAETLIVLGNHDLKQGYDADERFEKIFGVPAMRHITVKGFHFIGIPSSTQSAIQLTPPSKLIWAAKELKKAEEDSDCLPVFTFQHPHNRGTVYGSTIWGCDDLNKVWMGHSRVVNFSGHSHFPIEDPRSIWQGTYTSVGAGAMERFELEKDLIWAQHPDGYEDAAQFYIVEADLDGSVKLDAYDLNTDTFFLTYYIDNVNDPKSFAYTYKNRLRYDEAPVFPEGSRIISEKNDAGETVITFNKATDKLVVHDYKIKVKNHLGITVCSKTFISDYFLEGRPDTMTVNLGNLKLKDGKKYTVEITPVNAYYELGKPITAEFTA